MINFKTTNFSCSIFSKFFLRKKRETFKKIAFGVCKFLDIDMSGDYETQFPKGAADDNIVCLKVLVTMLEQCQYKGQILIFS